MLAPPAGAEPPVRGMVVLCRCAHGVLRRHDEPGQGRVNRSRSQVSRQARHLFSRRVVVHHTNIVASTRLQLLVRRRGSDSLSSQTQGQKLKPSSKCWTCPPQTTSPSDGKSTISGPKSTLLTKNLRLSAPPVKGEPPVKGMVVFVGVPTV